jgi:hypothetical protein
MNLSVRCFMFILLSSTLMVSDFAQAQHADQLGRLFSSPRERAELDEIRRIFLQDVAPGEELEQLLGDDVPIVPTAPDDLYLMLGGTVRRADGSYSLWINDEQVDQRQLPSNIRLARLGDLIVLWINYLDKLYVVRPGQVLHFASETVYEPYMLPEELASLIQPPPAQVIVQAPVNSATDNTAAGGGPAQSLSELPSGLLPGGEALGGLMENVSRISATLNLIQELTQ